MIRASFLRALTASAVIASALALAGCYGEESYQLPTRAMKELSPQLLAQLDEKHMPKDSPILVRLFKEESELEVWKQDTTAHFQLLKVYPICRWSGDLGPKVHEGDRQAPEGFYTITPELMNPSSNYYLAINTGFPNAFDKANDRHGAFLMIHGDCSSRGCYAMTDEQIGEIYSLARESFLGGQQSFQIQAYPFRMTPANLARHRTNPNMAFWKMIKEGNDHFEVTHLEPKVEVCNRHYVFDPAAPPKSTKPLAFNPTGRCPAYVTAPEMAELVQEKERNDEVQYIQMAKFVQVAPIHSGLDGGMNRVFLAQVGGQLPPARVPPPNALPAQPPPVADGGAQPTLASRLFGGLFGSRPAEPTQVATGEAGGAEATGTAASQKARSTAHSEIASAAAAKRNASEPHAVELRRTLSAPQETAAARPKPAAQETAAAKPTPSVQQEANAAPPPANTGTMNGAQPMVRVGSFDSRWGGMQ